MPGKFKKAVKKVIRMREIFGNKAFESRGPKHHSIVVFVKSPVKARTSTYSASVAPKSVPSSLKRLPSNLVRLFDSLSTAKQQRRQKRL